MNHVIILAAGQGQRMGMRKDKILLPVNGKPILYYSIMAFNDHPEIEKIISDFNVDSLTKIHYDVELYLQEFLTLFQIR